MNEQQLKEAFMQYLQQKSGAQTQQEFEAYIQQLGENGLQLEYAQFIEMLKQQLVAARKFGGMLNYVGKLRGVCPEGYEMQFFKQGGQICKKCVQKAKMEDGGRTPQNPIDAFKCGRKMKKKACGGSVKKEQRGGTVRTVKTVTTYPNGLEAQQRDVQYFSDGTQAVRNGGWNTNGIYQQSLRGRQGEFGSTVGTPRQKQIADSLNRVDWSQFGRGPVRVPSLKKPIKK